MLRGGRHDGAVAAALLLLQLHVGVPPDVHHEAWVAELAVLLADGTILEPAKVDAAVREWGLPEPALGAHLGVVDTRVHPLALPPRSTPTATYSTAPAPLAMAIFSTVVVKAFGEYLIEPTITDIEGLLALSKSKRVSRYARILGLHALKMEELLICSKNGNIKTIVRSPHHS